jgi:polar amino acid transport system substrate-binding protein
MSATSGFESSSRHALCCAVPSLLLLPLLLLFLSYPAGPVTEAVAEDTLARIKRDGVMKVANSGVYPPFESMQDGNLVGFDIDLTNLLAKDIGVRADIQVIDLKGLIPSLKSGKVDVLVTALTHTPERAEQVAFSDPYYNTAVVVVMRHAAAGVASKTDLGGKRVGAEIGSTGEREARSIPGTQSVKTYDTLMLALLDLRNDRLDAVVSNLPPVQYLIHRNFGDLKIVFRYNEGYVGVAMRKEDHSLVNAINQALERLRKSDQLRALEIRWFGQESKQENK